MFNLNLTGFFVKRLKAAAAVFIVGLLPLFISAVEASTGFDVPGKWEVDLKDLVLAWLAGMGVNYAVNVEPKE